MVQAGLIMMLTGLGILVLLLFAPFILPLIAVFLVLAVIIAIPAAIIKAFTKPKAQ